jgi:hypothetical protein
MAAVADFNGDGHPDWVLRNAGTSQTAIWYMNNNVFIGGSLSNLKSKKIDSEAFALTTNSECFRPPRRIN